MTNRVYYHSIDFFKFLCAIAVVVIHVSGPIFSNNLDTFYNYTWYRVLADVAVPFFFVSSGVFLGMKITSDNYKMIITNYIRKILFYFITFSIFYIIVRFFFVILDTYMLNQVLDKDINEFLSSLTIQSFLNGSIGYLHLWFLASLIYSCGFLLFMLFLKSNHIVIVLTGFVIFLFTNSYLVDVPDLFANGSISQGVLYVSIGYYLAKEDLIKYRFSIIFCVVFGALYFWSSIKADSQVTIILLALFVFYITIWCLQHPNFGKRSIITKLSRFSLPIYILHMFVLIIIENLYNYLGFEKWFLWKPHYFIALFSCVIVSIFLFKYILALGLTMKKLLIK